MGSACVPTLAGTQPKSSLAADNCGQRGSHIKLFPPGPTKRSWVFQMNPIFLVKISTSPPVQEPLIGQAE